MAAGCEVVRGGAVAVAVAVASTDPGPCAAAAAAVVDLLGLKGGGRMGGGSVEGEVEESSLKEGRQRLRVGVWFCE